MLRARGFDLRVESLRGPCGDPQLQAALLGLFRCSAGKASSVGLLQEASETA